MIVLMCISLIRSVIIHLLMCLLTISTSFSFPFLFLLIWFIDHFHFFLYPLPPFLLGYGLLIILLIYDSSCRLSKLDSKFVLKIPFYGLRSHKRCVWDGYLVWQWWDLWSDYI